MIMTSDFETFDLLGVGIGPFNMSLAALLSPLNEFNSIFFDGRPSFIWHAGQLMPEAEIQVSHMKDLVTLVDPTNPYSFLSFLRNKKRLYRFINSNFDHISRMEFSQYFEWVSQSLPNLAFAESVQDVKFKKSQFIMQTSKRVIRGKHLALGNGLTANIPSPAERLMGESVYHIKDFMRRSHNWKGKRVAVIGGGQSGAEAIAAIIADQQSLPERLSWISSRDHFAPIDESVFAQEIFTPNFSDYFYSLPEAKKAQIVRQQTLASDGISPKLLEQIYRRLYFLECVQKRPSVMRFLTGNKLVGMFESPAGGYELLLQNTGDNSSPRIIDADIVILATGFKWQFPAYLDGLKDRISLDSNGHFIVNRDYSIDWDGPATNRVYVQNGARHSHGVADPNLSLMAWRSATIINSLLGKNIYDLEGESAAMNWQNNGIESPAAPSLTFPKQSFAPPVSGSRANHSTCVQLRTPPMGVGKIVSSIC